MSTFLPGTIELKVELFIILRDMNRIRLGILRGIIWYVKHEASDRSVNSVKEIGFGVQEKAGFGRNQYVDGSLQVPLESRAN